MSSSRIVLVDPLGDVLFSGESWAVAHDDASRVEPERDVDDECPETLRSGESGIFPVARAKPRDERAA